MSNTNQYINTIRYGNNIKNQKTQKYIPPHKRSPSKARPEKLSPL